MIRKISFAVLSAMAFSSAVFAAGPRTDEVVQRDENQQQRIEQGLQSGQLTTGEAARLERGETRIERTEARDLRDGSLSKGEQARIEQGATNGSLTNREVGRLERGQAHVSRREARTAADGHVSAGEDARIQRAQNRQSRHIYRQRHD